MPVVEGTNLRMLRQYGSAGQARIPHVAKPPSGGGGIPHAGHAGGGNPMAPRGLDDEGHLLPPLGRPGTVSGIIGRMMDKADIADFNEKADKKAADKTAKIQAGIDAYAKNLEESGGDKNQAYIKTFSPDQEGHVHFIDPDVFNAIGAFHKNVAGSGEFGIKPLGGGYSVITGPGLDEGKVVTDKTLGRDPVTGALLPRPKADPESLPYDKPTPAALDGKVQAATTILRKVEELSQNLKATGPLGWGRFEMATARNTPFGGPQGQAYAGAYAVIQPAVQNLTRVVGMRDKATADAMRQMLPDPKLATPYLAAQAIPQIRDLARHVLAQSYTEAKGGHKDIFPSVAAAADTFDSTPARMERLDMVKQKLQTHPGSLDPGDMQVLQREFAKGRLNGEEQERTGAMMAQHGGFLTASQLGKLSQAYPGIAEKVQKPEFQLINPAWKKPLANEPATTPQPIPQVPTVPPTPQTPAGAPQAEVQGPPAAPQLNETPIGKAGQALYDMTAGRPGATATAPGERSATDMYGGLAPNAGPPRPGPEVAPIVTPTQEPASAGAPIPPAAGASVPPETAPTQPPGKQSGLLDMLNPIGSAQAAETPTQPPFDALRAAAVPEAGDQRPVENASASAPIPSAATPPVENAQASAPIPPRNPIGEAGTPETAPDATSHTDLLRGIRDMLMKALPDIEQGGYGG